MDTGLDTQADLSSTDAADRLRARDPDAMASFLRSWSGAVDRYCRTVCEPGLVAEAVEVAFADFLDKVDSHPIGDSHLESALMRSTRLTAAEAAWIDWDEPSAFKDGQSPRFDCQLTPLFLAGSPSAPASVETLARKDAHVLGCPRCQASARRFAAAEETFPGSKDADITGEVLEALLMRFSVPKGEPEVESDRVGTTLGGFRIIAIGGEDADGVAACTAVDEKAEAVALRLAPADRDAAFTARFLRDARVLASLAHPSLPSVRAVGEAPEGAYIVTEELQTRSLASVVQNGLPTTQAIRMLGEVADALDVAHAAGLLHRQLRPSNVVVGAWLVVRPLLVNFALGRSRDVVRNGEQTPYLAPDELRGETIGPAADRYALACTLFEVLTGRAPFGTPRDSATRGHLDEPPPRASDVRPDLPPALDAVFARALSETPDERFATAAELASEIAGAMSAPAVPAPSQPVAPDVEPEAKQQAAAQAQREPDVEPEAAPPESSAPGGGYEADALDSEAVAVGATAAPPEPGPPPDVAGDPRTGTRRRRGLVAASGIAAVGGLVAAFLVGGGLSDEERSSSPERTPTAPAGEGKRRASVKPRRQPSPPVVLAGTKVTDYDPNGGNGEHPENVGALTDGDPKTEWLTEDYPRGTFGRGVGVYVSLPRAQSVREVEIRTTTPDWNAEVYGAAAGPPADLPAPGWRKLGSRSITRRLERIDLRKDSQPIRYCLVWITKLPTPGFVSIAELRLFR